MVIAPAELVEAAVACGFIRRREEVRGTSGRPADVADRIALRGRIPAEAVFRAVAERRGLPFADPNRDPPAMGLVRRLPASLLQRGRVLPLLGEGGTVVLACADPDDRAALEAVRCIHGGPVQVALADPAALACALDRVLEVLGTVAPPAAAGPDPVGILDRIVKEAWLRHASDIHLEPDREGLRVRVRVDGILRDVLHLPTGQRAPLVSRVKVLAGLDIAEQRAPQDGGFTYEMPFAEQASVDVRVATMPTVRGERATLRLLGTETRELTLESLGMDPEELEQFRGRIRRPYGIVLLSGPTGSGKTTTLYAALQEINRPEINVLTVEDPVELQLPGINQVHVGGTDKLTFAGALRALLRHDPDVLMLGEVRDLETADAAVKAAMTGHMVFSTLHTNSACDAVGRLLDIGCEAYRIAATLEAVVAQRLVRRLCPRCRTTRPATSQEARFLWCESPQVGAPGGCAACVGTGYRGRIGLFERLWIDPVLAGLIASGATGAQLAEGAGHRLRTLRGDARRKVLDLVVTVEEAMAATVFEE